MNKFVKKEWIEKAIIDLGIKKYTKIQNYTIPKIIRGENCIGVSPTGTGKTYCFLIPIIENLEQNIHKVQAVVILPTRELARQIYSKFNFFRKYFDFNLKLIIGGKVNDHFNKEQIIISTPQKFLEASLSKKIDLSFVKTIVFDEVDMLIDANYSELFKNIFDLIPNIENIQKIAFSATLHEMLSNQLAIYFKNTPIYDISESIWKNNNKIKHHLIHSTESKEITLKAIVDQISPFFCIIFANKKTEVEEIYLFLKEAGVDIAMLHGGLESRLRKNIYKNIEQKTMRFLVSTDIASRGIDIEGVSHIISYNLPLEDLWFMHRVGRTGRNNQSGISYTLVSAGDELKISRLKNKGIEWNNFKLTKNGLERYDYQFRRKPVKKFTEVDKEIKFIISTAPKKVKPNYKKRTGLKIKEVKRKAKRKAIDKSVKENLIKGYKIANSKKTKEKADNNED